MTKIQISSPGYNLQNSWMCYCKLKFFSDLFLLDLSALVTREIFQGVKNCKIFSNKVFAFCNYFVKFCKNYKIWNKNCSVKYFIYDFSCYMDASEPKWVYSNYILYGVSTLKLEGLHIRLAIGYDPIADILW